MFVLCVPSPRHDDPEGAEPSGRLTRRGCTPGAGPTTKSWLGSLQDMPIKLENIGIAVEDLEATIAFFTDLGRTLLGRDTVSGEWTDTAVGLDGNHANIAMLQTPDGNGRLELFEHIHPDAIKTEPTQPNEIGMHRVAFSVDDIDEALKVAAAQRMPPAAWGGDLPGRLQADLRSRPQWHHRDARGGTQEELIAD